MDSVGGICVEGEGEILGEGRLGDGGKRTASYSFCPPCDFKIFEGISKSFRPATKLMMSSAKASLLVQSEEWFLLSSTLKRSRTGKKSEIALCAKICADRIMSRIGRVIQYFCIKNQIDSINIAASQSLIDNHRVAVQCE